MKQNWRSDAFARRIARGVRHLPGIRRLDALWSVLRPGYLAVLRTLSNNRGVPVTISGHSIRVAPEFANVSWETVESKAYEAFSAIVHPGDVVFDVGAHFGTYSIIGARRASPDGSVIAYEPSEFTRGVLRQHLIWNGVLDKVIVRPYCCGAARMQTEFYCKPDEAEASSSLIPTAGLMSCPVQVTTLDAEVAKLRRVPSIIKIDVEGAEWDVLRGAEQSLLKYKPKLLLSLHPEALAKIGTTPTQIMDWLADRGYTLQILDQDHEIHVLAEAS